MALTKEFLVERDGRQFVRYAGLLDLAHQQGLKGITTTLIQAPTAENGMVTIVRASIETERGACTGLGDASPSNVTRLMAPHLVRMAETRVKARALRDAVNVGVTALEELGDDGSDLSPTTEHRRPQDIQKLTGRYLELVAEALPLGLDAPDIPDGATAVNIVELGKTLRRRIDQVKAAQAQDGPIEATAAAPTPSDEPPPAIGDGDLVRTNAEARQFPARLGSAPATPQQRQTILGRARQLGKTIEVNGLTRAQASQLRSALSAETSQERPQ